MPWESRPVHLSAQQRKELKAIAGDPDSAPKEKCRALMVLLMAEGWKNMEIAEHLGVHQNTVVKWRNRWCMENNQDANVQDYGEQPGRPVSILTPSVLGRLEDMVKEPPKNKRRWTVRLLAKKMGLTLPTTQRALEILKIDLRKISETYKIESSSDTY